MDEITYDRSSLEYSFSAAIRQGKLAEDLRAAVHRWIATSDEFNQWFLSGPKRSGDEQWMLHVLDVTGDAQDAVEAAWAAAQVDSSPAVQTELRASIEKSIESMKAVMAERSER